MALGAGTCIELPILGLDTNGQGQQWNFSVGNRCSLTNRCGEACFLNRVQPQTPEMSDELRIQAALELISAGRTIRHLSCVEKEPFENELLLKQILREFHKQPKESRPQAIGAITSGLRLRQADWLGDEVGPLSWLMVSLDGLRRTHHRGPELWEPALAGLMRVKRREGALACGVNTVLTNYNFDSVLGLGERLIETGIDYWGVSPWMDVEDGQMISQVSFHKTLEMYEQLSTVFEKSPLRIVFEMPTDVFAYISGVDPFGVVKAAWRLEHRAEGSAVIAATMNPDPGRWFRLRFDGQILDMTDLRTVGLLEGRYGSYHPGWISRLVDSSENAWRKACQWNPDDLAPKPEVAR
jgi:hypothetical protein